MDFIGASLHIDQGEQRLRMKRYQVVLPLIGMLLLAACVPATVAPATSTPVIPPPITAPPTDTAAAPTSTTALTDTPVATDTSAPATDTAAPPTDTAAAPTDTSAPATDTAAPAPSATTGGPTATSGPEAAVAPVSYIDDRSDPTALMTSFANAINQHQYLRAYSYWRTGAVGLPTFESYENGYSTTASIDISFGTITGDAGAGQLYYSVPTKLVSHLTDNSVQTYVGCYILHLSQPAIQDAPPFQGLSIDSAKVSAVANNADTTTLLGQACSANPGGPLPVTATPVANDISAARYLDDRSDAVQVLRSLFNAVNRQEYDRAYSYWESGAQGLPAYAQFKQGYANTAAVTLTVGTVTEDAGAGQRYWAVPVTLVSRSTANVTQTFVGCYTLHLGLPDAQGVPPYQPIGIRSATNKLVANDADTGTLMTTACPAQ